VTLYSAPDQSGERDAHALRPRPISADSAAALRAARRRLTVLLILVQIRVLRYAYMQLGVTSGAAFFPLFASLFGSYINIPVAALDRETMVTEREVTYFGMRYIVPVMVDSPGVILAANVGGAGIPTLLSIYLLSKNRLWGRGLIAIACVATICHPFAQPVHGVGIALPIFVPPFVAAITAAIVSWRNAAPLAYAGGSLGVLIGADLSIWVSFRASGRPSHRSVAPALSTAYSSPASSRFCWQGLPAGGRHGERFEPPFVRFQNALVPP
jgi:uncharacterized membrane protein